MSITAIYVICCLMRFTKRFEKMLKCIKQDLPIIKTYTVVRQNKQAVQREISQLQCYDSHLPSKHRGIFQSLRWASPCGFLSGFATQPHADPELLGYYLQQQQKRILAPTSVFLKHPWEKQEKKKDMIKNKHVNPGKKNPKPPSPRSFLERCG